MFFRERNWNRQLNKLRKILWKVINNSREFKEFQKKLAERNMNVDIFLGMFIWSKKSGYLHTSPLKEIKGRKREKLRLTRQDREFLRKIGVKWD